jgi:transposase
VLAADHLVRYVVGIISELDLGSIYAAYAPELLLGLLVYGYATGIFSSRKLAQATYESLPFIYIAGGQRSSPN